jgi:hypothetical protein
VRWAPNRRADKDRSRAYCQADDGEVVESETVMVHLGVRECRRTVDHCDGERHHEDGWRNVKPAVRRGRHDPGDGHTSYSTATTTGCRSYPLSRTREGGPEAAPSNDHRAVAITAMAA